MALNRLLDLSLRKNRAVDDGAHRAAPGAINKHAATSARPIKETGYSMGLAIRRFVTAG
jgi:hypothetical protein